MILILGLALYQPILVKIRWGSSEKLFHVRYFLLSFRRPKKRKKSVKKEKQKEKGDRDWHGILEWIKLAPELLNTVGKGLKILFRYSEVRSLKVEGTLGAEDPAVTGTLWGLTQTFYGNLTQWTSPLEIDVTPDFIDGNTELNLDTTMSLRMGGILTSVAIILWYLPKRQLWRIIRKSKRK